MKNKKILSTLILYAATACGTTEEVTPTNHNASNTSSGLENSTTGGNDAGGSYDNGGGMGGFTGYGGNDNQGGFGGATGTGGAGGDCEDLTGRFTTYSQGGWNNHANILPQTLFVNGVLIGKDSSDYALFTSVNAVTDFLPAMGTPGALQGQYTNPLTTPAGVLAGQTLTLKLNVLTSSKACGYSLGDLLVAEGLCKGKNVSEVLSLADQALSGTTISLSYSELNKCAEKINLNFKEGNVDNQYLKMP